MTDRDGYSIFSQNDNQSFKGRQLQSTRSRPNEIGDPVRQKNKPRLATGLPAEPSDRLRK
jgi:hypothetical protein